MLQSEEYPSKALKDAVEAISSLPGVGRRSALRLALHLLKQPADKIHHFASAIGELADGVHYCKTCMMVSDGDTCSICADTSSALMPAFINSLVLTKVLPHMATTAMATT